MLGGNDGGLEHGDHIGGFEAGRERKLGGGHVSSCCAINKKSRGSVNFSSRLDRLDAATSLKDLAGTGGNRLEALKGDRAGQYSIRMHQRSVADLLRVAAGSP